MNKSNKILATAFNWLVDWGIEHSPTIITLIVAGGGMTYLASITSYLAQYGLIVWCAIGIFSFLLVSLAFLCWGLWQSKKAITEFTQKQTFTKSTNPLSPLHKDEKLNLIEFFHPFYKPTKNVRFENCDLMGPALILADGGSFDECNFIDCEIVIVREDRPIKGGIHLLRPSLIHCHLYRITFIMPFNQYNTLPAAMKKGTPVISDGRVGDI